MQHGIDDDDGWMMAGRADEGRMDEWLQDGWYGGWIDGGRVG